MWIKEDSGKSAKKEKEMKSQKNVSDQITR